jgi:hypothetical protein
MHPVMVEALPASDYDHEHFRSRHLLEHVQGTLRRAKPLPLAPQLGLAAGARALLVLGARRLRGER